MKLTGDVVKIAEWLGFERTEVEDSRGDKFSLWLGPNRKKEWSKGQIMLWLQSAEGERAMMDKLGELRIRVSVEPPCKTFKFYDIFLYQPHIHGDFIVKASGDTRIEALINAILEMSKNDKR